MKRMILWLFFILALSGISIAENIDIDRTAEFFSGYTEMFNLPPNYVVYNKTIIDISSAYILFLSYVAEKEIDKDISMQDYRFETDKDCTKRSIDIRLAAEKAANYIKTNKKFPKAIKIDDCYISNTDFLYVLSEMAKDMSSLGRYSEYYDINKRYFEDIIKWDSKDSNNFLLITLDYESDRPVFSDTFDLDTGVASDNKSIATDPKKLKKLCFNGFCTLPEDYNIKYYTSMDIAWPTAVKKDGSIVFPDCYPFCGAKNGSRILLDNFVQRYGIPVSLHMTGDSIIAIASDKGLYSNIMELKQDGLLELGMHTMYHTNLRYASERFIETTLKNNYEVFVDVFHDDPVEFRAPYLDMPANYSNAILKSFNILSDNEIKEACQSCRSCNLELCNDMHFVKIDWKIEDDDKLLNIYFAHPWEFIYSEKGMPVYLVEDNETGKKILKRWMYLIGDMGLVPTTAKRFITDENKK